MRRFLTATLLLTFFTTANAQVLDDDIEFDEHHVATIVLDKDSPVLETLGVGLSREITYQCQFEGTLYVHKKTPQGMGYMRAGGGRARTRLDRCKLRGEEHLYNQPDPKNDEFAVCHPFLERARARGDRDLLRPAGVSERDEPNDVVRSPRSRRSLTP